MIYAEPSPIARNQAEAALGSESNEAAAHSLIRVAFYERIARGPKPFACADYGMNARMSVVLQRPRSVTSPESTEA
jgi:hypothetical protein